MSQYQKNTRRPTMAFSLSDVGFALTVIPRLFRASASDMSVATFKRFFLPRNGNTERVASFVGMLGTDPYVLQHIVHSTEGDYTTLKDGTVYVIRDYDLFVKCSVELSFRGEGPPALLNRCYPGAAFQAHPGRYGDCPFGDWDVYAKQEPHFMFKDRLPEQESMIRKTVVDHMQNYIGKTEDLGKMLRLLVWNVFTYTSFGVAPSEETARQLEIYDALLPEFDYAVRQSGSQLEHEWSPQLQAMVDEMERWGHGVFEDRAANIDQCTHFKDVTTDVIANHRDIPLSKSEGATRAVYAGGANNTHTAMCGIIGQNATHEDDVYKYYMQNQSQNMEDIYREGLRLFSSIPTIRDVRDEDNLVIDGKKLETGTDVILATYPLQTDPRYWDRPMEFDPSRFKGTVETEYLTSKGFAPFGAAQEGGRPCGGRYYVVNMMRIMLDELLRNYKITGKKGGAFEMKQLAGAARYTGNYVVTVEKR